MRKIFLLTWLILLAALTACGGAVIAPTPLPPTATPTVVVPTPTNLPLTEADVPRVSVAEAQAALDSGSALFFDVRDPKFYAQGHIQGAKNLPLANIERNPANIQLKKDRWIITYCA